MEARSFYTYYLRTLSGVTRGSYKLNTTVGTSNEANTSQPKRADRSDLLLCHSGLREAGSCAGRRCHGHGWAWGLDCACPTGKTQNRGWFLEAVG